MKSIVVAGLAFALSGCFLTPGQFGSSLDVRRDGRFSFAYQGEVRFVSPEGIPGFGPGGGGAAETWSDDQASCYGAVPGGQATPKTSKKSKDGAVDDTMSEDFPRDCTPAEIAQQKAEWEKLQEASRKRRADEAKRFAALFGYTPSDDAANQKLAQAMMRYEGYRSVTYKGDGLFVVDYRTEGRLDHDFVFPLIPQQSGVILPFVTIQRQADGAVRVRAPGYVGGGALATMQRLGAATEAAGASAASGKARDAAAMAALAKAGPKGQFTLTTDATVLTNNTENGPAKAAGGQSFTWEVGPAREVPPEALVALGKR